MVVCNNAQYRILKVGGKGLGLAAATQDALVGMDLNQPTIDFVALATSLGVRAARLTEPDEIQDALRDSLRANRPCLLDIPVDPGMPAGTDVLDH